jgi:tetratricopeptide (TPR) repeat protein
VSRPQDGEPAVRDVAPESGVVSLRRAGQLLAESFLPEPASAALAGLVERAVRSHVALRVGVDAAGLAGLPWEALPDPASGLPLALHPQVVMYRRSEATEPAALAGPLRIVVAIASPEAGGGALLDYEHELRAVLAAVRQARRSQARVEVVPFATTRAIRAALDVPGGVHVLHISAHGRPGVLVLEDEDGRARAVSAEQLVLEAVPPGRMPPVVALAACYTDVDGEQQGSSFAARLAGRGACAVIGTQTSVSDRYATLLFARVYAELAASDDPDVVRAVADARRLVQRELLTGTDRAAQVLAGMDEWGVVTLLANAPQLPVVDHTVPRVPAPAPRTAQWGPVAARPVGQFVGRRGLQRQLPDVLGGDEYAGLVLHGIGGVGKTTLAAEVLRRTVEADPAWRVVSLFGPLSADTLLAEVATVARRELLRRQAVTGPATVAVQTAVRVELSWEDRFALLRDDVLDEMPILLVLDNFEDNLTPGTDVVADPALAGLLAAWAAAPARSRMLITSRHPIALPGGAAGRLQAVPVGPLSAGETGKLLWSLPRLDLHAAGSDAIERIWRGVGGHPRSLEYLDALLGQGHGRFDDITARLTTAVTTRLGADRAATWLAQDRTLDAAVADTVTLAADEVLLTDHLNRLAAVPGAIEVLMAISVYREPVPTAALTFHTGVRLPAEQIAADVEARQAISADISALLARYDLTADQLALALAEDAVVTSADQAALRELLDGLQPRPPYTEPAGLAELVPVLAGSSLAHHDPNEGVVFMHRWTATELHERWQRTATLDAAKDPLRRAHRTAAEYWRWRVQAWPQDRDADLHDLLECRHHLLAAGELDTASATTEDISSRLDNTGAWDRAISLIHDTLRWLPNGSPRYSAYIHRLGNLALRRGDSAEAERRYQQALAIYERLGDQTGPANSYGQLGILAHYRGDYAEAERRYQQCLAMFERIGNQAGVASSYHQLGILAHLRGDYAAAERRYQQSLTIKEQIGNQAGLASSLHQVGLLAHDRGDYAEAERRYQQSLTIKEQLGEPATLATSLSQLANLRADTGDSIAAIPLHIRALAIRLDIGVPTAAYTIQRLVRIRDEIGEVAFSESARRALDGVSYDDFIALLDANPPDQPGEG